MPATVHFTFTSRPPIAGADIEDGRDVIVLGRAPTCSIVFDPNEHRMVSSRHAQVLVREGALFVEDLGSRNGTQVNDRTIEGPTRLGPGDVVRLGGEGPTFTASLRPAGAPGPSSDDDPAYAATLLKAPAPRAAPEGGGAVRAGGPPSPPARRRRTEGAATLLREARRGRDGAAEGPIGVQTLLGVLQKVQHKERRRLYAVGGAALLLLAAILAVTLQGSPPPVTAAPAGDMTSVIASLESSVYLVLVRTPTADGSFVEAGQGTAWSVREGWLATNAHVAKLYDELKPGQTLIARSATTPPTDLVLCGSRIHPGYTEWLRLLARIRPFVPAAGETYSTTTPCDVALLQVAEGDRPRQSPPLPLASNQDAMALRNGQILAFAGFPMESMAGGGTDVRAPRPNTSIFSLSRSSDPFHGSASDPSKAHLLTYNFESTGGCSGSPIANADGRVIGFLSAGNVGLIGPNGRVMTGGTMYGPRIDMLAELLDDSVARTQPSRSAEWEARLRSMFEEGAKGKGILSALAVDLCRSRGSDPKRLSLVHDEELLLTKGRPVRFGKSLPNGTYICAFACVDAPAPLAWSVAIGRQRLGSGTSSTWFHSMTITVGTGGNLAVTMDIPKDDQETRTRVVLRLWRVG